MAFILYRESTQSVLAMSEENTFVEGEGLKIIEQDLVIEDNYSLALVLSADGESVENKYPGKTYEEQRSLVESETTAQNLEEAKKNKKIAINSFALSRIEDLQWKLEKAQDLDLLGGTTTNVDAVYSEFQQIKDAASAYYESEVAELTTVDEIIAVDSKGFLS